MSSPVQRKTRRVGVRRRHSGSEKDEAKKPKIVITHLLDTYQRQKHAGTVLTFGQGDVGQLGLGVDILEKGRPSLVTGIDNIVNVVCGGMHTVFLTSDGTVLSFGCFDDGALGRDANDDNSFSPGEVTLPGPAVQVTAGDSHSAALLEDGRVFAWGSFRDNSGNMGLVQPFKVEKNPIQILSEKTVVKIASGSNHLVMLTRQGQVYTCGCAEQGQLGRISARFSNRESRQGVSHLLSPELVTFHARIRYEFVDIWATSYSTFVKEKSRGIFVFGLNNFQQLGVPNPDNQSVALYIPKLSQSFNVGTDWIKICGGDHHTLALDIDGKVYTLGKKEYGRLGLGEDCDDARVPTIIPLLNERKCTDIACGSSVSFAVTDTSECFAWGFGSNKQLGQGEDEDDLHVPTIVRGKQLENKRCVAVSAGGQHTAVLVLPALTNGSA